jgi:glutamate 5-kinase
MKTKLRAAKICTENGCDMVIANGERPEQLYDIVTEKEGNYTRFFKQ